MSQNENEKQKAGKKQQAKKQQQKKKQEKIRGTHWQTCRIRKVVSLVKSHGKSRLLINCLVVLKDNLGKLHFLFVVRPSEYHAGEKAKFSAKS